MPFPAARDAIDDVPTDGPNGSPTAAERAGKMILPLALAQFIASYAATNMNVAISATDVA